MKQVDNLHNKWKQNDWDSEEDEYANLIVGNYEKQPLHFKVVGYKNNVVPIIVNSKSDFQDDNTIKRQLKK